MIAWTEQQRVEQLFVQLETKLTNVVYRWLWNREDARDVIQEAFVRLWQMRDRVDWERAEALVYRIAINLASNKRRSRRVWQFVTFGEQAVSDEPGVDVEQELAVRRAIEALPERQRRVLILSLHSNMTYEQIADVLDIAPGTVASRRNTAVAKVRAAMLRWEKSRE